MKNHWGLSILVSLIYSYGNGNDQFWQISVVDFESVYVNFYFIGSKRL
jgi:hypothetical protein